MNNPALLVLNGNGIKGTRKYPITHGSSDDRGYKFCKCFKCGTIEECVPSFDFYTLERDGGTGPLYCESCFFSECYKKEKVKEKGEA